MNSTNLFIESSTPAAKLRQESNSLVAKICADLKEAYCNIKHFESTHSDTSSIFRIGCHRNENCTHSFTVNQDGTLSFMGYSILVFKKEARYAKAMELLSKYPKSTYGYNSFVLKIGSINSETIQSVVKDIVLALEWDGFTLRY